MHCGLQIESYRPESRHLGHPQCMLFVSSKPSLLLEAGLYTLHELPLTKNWLASPLTLEAVSNNLIIHPISLVSLRKHKKVQKNIIDWTNMVLINTF